MKQKQRILVVDDEASNRTLIAAVLEDVFAVSIAEDGEQALKLARLERPQVVLLDVRLPRMDGFELCRELRSDPATRDIAILIMTATDSREYRERATEAGADGFLAKPLSPNFLRTVLIARLNPARTGS